MPKRSSDARQTHTHSGTRQGEQGRGDGKKPRDQAEGGTQTRRWGVPPSPATYPTGSPPPRCTSSGASKNSSVSLSDAMSRTHPRARGGSAAPAARGTRGSRRCPPPLRDLGEKGVRAKDVGAEGGRRAGGTRGVRPPLPGSGAIAGGRLADVRPYGRQVAREGGGSSAGGRPPDSASNSSRSWETPRLARKVQPLTFTSRDFGSDAQAWAGRRPSRGGADAAALG